MIQNIRNILCENLLLIMYLFCRTFLQNYANLSSSLVYLYPKWISFVVQSIVYSIHRTLHILDAVLDSITMAYEIASLEVKSSRVAGSIICYPLEVPAVIRAPLTPTGQGSITPAVVQHISWKYYHLVNVLTLDFLHS